MLRMVVLSGVSLRLIRSSQGTQAVSVEWSTPDMVTLVLIGSLIEFISPELRCADDLFIHINCCYAV